MEKILNKFLRYIAIDTQSDESFTGGRQPSAERELNLSRLLVEELHALGVKNASLDDNGYVYIKVSMEQKMVLKHRYVWEQANGPIPDGHNIAFRDGDRQNCDISNLYLISREDAAREQIKNETAEHRAARVVKATATRNETIRRDRIRIHWGFEPHSKLVKRW